MKVIFEGSVSDIKLMINSKVESIVKTNSVKVEPESNHHRNDASSLNQNLVALGCRFEALQEEHRKSLISLAEKDTIIQRLQFQMNELKNKIDVPIVLTSSQEEELEKHFQAMCTEFSIKPLTLVSTTKPQITAEELIVNLFTLIASGNRVGAIKEMRTSSGLNLVRAKNLFDNALRAFGCKVSDAGSPLSFTTV